MSNDAPVLYRYLFGPVVSRRYGRSLGVDLAVPKTCTLNCLFCQLGATPQTTVERADRPPISEVLAELRGWLKAGNMTNFITAGGSGEPTLHRHFGDLLRAVRSETPFKSLVLSNGSLFYMPEIRREAALADVVKVSLHAWDQTSFERIVRPHPSLRFETILDGYRDFREQYDGRLDLEVFIVPGLNDAPEQARRIAALAQTFMPDTITLNTAVRPPAEGSVALCPPDRLEALTALFGSAAKKSGKEPEKGPFIPSEEALVALVNRHPVSLHALASMSDMTEETLRARLDPLVNDRRIRLFESQNVLFVGRPTR